MTANDLPFLLTLGALVVLAAVVLVRQWLSGVLQGQSMPPCWCGRRHRWW